MNLDDLIEELGYAGDPGLLDPAVSVGPPGIAHHLRRARQTCGLRYAYALRPPDGEVAIPLVYLCEAPNDDHAQQVHRRVWNQNLAPFLVVSTPTRFVLYPGFRLGGRKTDEIASVVKSATAALDEFQGLDARAIAEGRVWERWGNYLDPAGRVDWSLLNQLEELGKSLTSQHRLSRHTAHALIGKYIYLHYLRHRNILSDAKLGDWGIEPAQVFGRNATLAAFASVTERLEEWLNGSVFPIDLPSDTQAIAAVQQTAAILAGDEASGQLHLGFRRYDFSHIPIETLSVIYQQFLHAEDAGRSKGAYYTPTFLVDLVLDEVATRRPLVPGVRVLDPACGSGVFLVQTYRRLIERQISLEDAPSPPTLSTLLTDHIFGIDQDEDACRVAAFSLTLTLLDYVEPPDLRRFPGFKLPALYGSNIVRGDFFDPEVPWPVPQFDWVVGNPPWIALIPHKLLPSQRSAYQWIEARQNDCPIGGGQLAEAFLWKTLEHLRPDGAAGMLAPAMSLFKSQSRKFRAAFFSRVPVWCVANFANLAYVLFAGRANLPAAVLFFQAPGERESSGDILSFTPFAVNQPTLLKKEDQRLREAWTLAVNGGELKRVDRKDAARGDGLTWKLVMWGSPRDRRVLERMTRRFPSFSHFREAHELKVHEGLQLRRSDTQEAVEFVPELVGKRRLKMEPLERHGRLLAFPESALDVVTADIAFVRKRGGVALPMQVCSPPHLIVPRNRRWAIYDDDFLVVPNRQLGIAGRPGQETLLKALTLYLISDFATYHQFFNAAEMDIQMSVADLKTLMALPVPLDALGSEDLERWAQAYDGLVACWTQGQERVLVDHRPELQRLEQQANRLVSEGLGLSDQERWLVEDLVHSRLGLIKGKLGKDNASKQPDESRFRDYGEALRGTLDAFAARSSDLRHHVEIWPGRDWGAVTIRVDHERELAPVVVRAATQGLHRELTQLGDRLRLRHTHWLYFERGLTIFEPDRVILVKPMQGLHWLRSQALQDADNLIADALHGAESTPWH